MPADRSITSNIDACNLETYILAGLIYTSVIIFIHLTVMLWTCTLSKLAVLYGRCSEIIQLNLITLEKTIYF